MFEVLARYLSSFGNGTGDTISSTSVASMDAATACPKTPVQGYWPFPNTPGCCLDTARAVNGRNTFRCIGGYSYECTTYYCATFNSQKCFTTACYPYGCQTCSGGPRREIA